MGAPGCTPDRLPRPNEGFAASAGTHSGPAIPLGSAGHRNGVWHGRRRILLTSLLDAKAWPAKEIAAQYQERWQIETSYRELKQDMLGDELTLRSGTPETVRQEVWGTLLAYNLVRLEMAEIAREVGVAPTDLSFMTALHYWRYEWSWLAISSPGTLPARLLRLRERLGELRLPKQRRGRECPPRGEKAAVPLPNQTGSIR